MAYGIPLSVDIPEAFIVCEDYAPPTDYVPTMANPLLDHQYSKKWPLHQVGKCSVFLSD